MRWLKILNHYKVIIAVMKFVVVGVLVLIHALTPVHAENPAEPDPNDDSIV